MFFLPAQFLLAIVIIEQCKQARVAARRLASLNAALKKQTLNEIAITLRKHEKEVLAANRRDLESAASDGVGPELVRRLGLDPAKIEQMARQIETVAELPDPVGRLIRTTKLADDLILSQVSRPIGVIGAIFESRPDALTQIAALCFKAGNGLVLKGGREALFSNRILHELFCDVLERVADLRAAVQLIETRAAVDEILKLDHLIDLLVPRGGGELVRYIQDHTRIPVLGHADGVCHTYVDARADLKKALRVTVDAKCQYPAVCNATETLLVHRDVAAEFLPRLERALEAHNVELRGDPVACKIFENAVPAQESDWGTEYNDLILAVRIVDSADEAIDFINTHGSQHTDALISEDAELAQRFMDGVDSASVMVNASTRFADGYRFGLGAEIGVSTARIHARGPVGLEGLVSYQYRLTGDGQTVGDFSGPEGESFQHKILFPEPGDPR